MSTKQELYLGIDTSNYTTSLAIADGVGDILANWKQPLPVAAGERGLRQSDAVFAHVKNLPLLTERLYTFLQSNALHADSIRGIGYSAFPRRVQDSYMPCFLAGRVVAGALRATTQAPEMAFSHQEGHVMAALYSAGQTEELLQREFVAFHVSGGTTDVLLVRPAQTGFSIECIGESLDLHAGQAVDRIGVAMGLDFPCGRALEQLAAQCDAPVPKPRISVKDTSCHLSGLENLSLALYQKTNDAALTAAYTLDFIGQTLLRMSENVRRHYPDIPILFAGGVMSNARIQGIVKTVGNAHFATPEYAADNAAGIALLCRRCLTLTA